MGVLDRLEVTEAGGACTFCVHVVPRSRRNAIVGVHEKALRVRLQAPPVEGKANEALQALLADRLGVSKSHVQIVAGQTSRRKTVRVAGVQADQVRALLSEVEEETA